MARLTTAVAGVTALVLLFLCALSNGYWLVRSGYVWSPTATPTATPRPLDTPTPDFRATRFAEDVLTQVAYSVALATQAARLPPPTAQVVVVVVTPAPSETAPATPATSTVILPVVSTDGGATPTAPPVDTQPSPTPPSDVQSPISPLPTVGPSDAAGFTATPTLPPPQESTPTVESPSPTPALVEQPSPLPTVPPTPALTPSAYTVNTLRAEARPAGITLLIGPSNRYSDTGSVGGSADVTLYGRDETGEWVYACCTNVDGRDERGWVRQAYVTIVDNELEPGAPPSATPNDARWLRVQPPPPSPEVPPTATPIPGEDYPLYRFAHSNRGRVPLLPGNGLVNGWPAAATAAGSLTSPVVVMGNNVIVASADNHVYSFDRQGGNQRWRYDLKTRVTVAPAVQDGWLYLVGEDRQVTAFQNFGGSPKWQRTLDWPATGGINVAGNKLFIPTGQGDSHTVVVLDRFNGDELRKLASGPAVLRYVAIGQQLVYVGGQGVWAYDLENFEEVWREADIGNVQAPPVYAYPGEQALAELYVATDTGLYSLDANTKQRIWLHDNRAITGLAVAGPTVYASGNAFVEALARRDRAVVWRGDTPGNPVTGPLVDESRLLIVTETDVQVFDRTSRALLGSASLSPIAAAPAVSGGWVYVPSTNSQLYAFRAN